MPHIKSFYSLNKLNEFNYCILTSSNLSGAAWGTLQKNSSQLMIRSFELGLLFLPEYIENRSLNGKRKSANKFKFVVAPNSSIIDLDNEDEFDELILPLPYNIKPPCYSKSGNLINQFYLI